MTEQQNEVLNKWQAAGGRFAGYFFTAAGEIVITILEWTPEPGKNFPPALRLVYDKTGALLSSSLYPRVITPNNNING